MPENWRLSERDVRELYAEIALEAVPPPAAPTDPDPGSDPDGSPEGEDRSDPPTE